MELPGSEGFGSVRVLLGSEDDISSLILSGNWSISSCGAPRLRRLQLCKDSARLSRYHFLIGSIKKLRQFELGSSWTQKAFKTQSLLDREEESIVDIEYSR